MMKAKQTSPPPASDQAPGEHLAGSISLFPIAAGFLLLSGIASLTYQVTWVRLLGLSMGSTSASISTVLAAFFLGMALGSYLAERIARDRIHSLTPYIVLELCIGLGGLALLPLLFNLDKVLALAPAFGTWLSLKFLLALALLCVPTICMGATFPVMASILIRRQNEIGLRLGQLYGLNTAGAVLGAILSGFVFIPFWGLDGAVHIAAALNLLIVLAGLYVNKRWRFPPLEHPDSSVWDQRADDSADKRSMRLRALLVLCATGFVAIATQVGWSKYLVIFVGSTVYGLTIILAVFLVGIASGSWAIRRHLEPIRSPERWMGVMLVLLGVSLVLTRVGLSWLPPAYEAVNNLPVPAPVLHGVKYAIVFVLLFVPTFLFGALFPLNLKLYCGDLSGVRARVGKAYALNTAASIFGAIVAGFWIIPAYGTDTLLTTLAMVFPVLAGVFLLSIKGGMHRLTFALAAVLALVGAWRLPHLSYEDLISSVEYRFDTDVQAGRPPRFLFLKEGKAGVISLVTYDESIAKLQTNGINESFINMREAGKDLLVETLLGVIPYGLHERPRTAFVLGFGGGITTRALALTELETIRVVELEPAIVEAVRVLRAGHIPVLRDPRFRLDYNDARNTLLVEQERYDIIVSQPSHPWLARASNVFTLEFWRIVKSRLNEGGIFGQWVNLFNMDSRTLKSILRAFYTVFPYGMSFADLNTGDLLLYGSVHPLQFNYERLDGLLAKPKLRAMLEHHGMYTTKDLLWYFGLSRREAVAASVGEPPNTDRNILSEVRLSLLTKDPTGEGDPYAFLRRQFQLDLIPYLGEGAADRLYEQADYYFSWGDYQLAEKAASQLAKLDPVRARGVEYELHVRLLDYEAALVLYAQHGAWPDRTQRQHALVLAKLGREAEAWETSERIVDSTERQLAIARLCFQLGGWERLDGLDPLSDEERRWRLAGAAEHDLVGAGAQLARLVRKDSKEVAQLTVLLRYYSALDDRAAILEYSRRLTEAIGERIEDLSSIAENAMKDEQQERAMRAVEEIERLNPGFEGLTGLHAQLQQLASEDL